MLRHQWPGRTLQVGDKVRLKHGTPTWAQREASEVRWARSWPWSTTAPRSTA